LGLVTVKYQAVQADSKFTFFPSPCETFKSEIHGKKMPCHVSAI